MEAIPSLAPEHVDVVCQTGKLVTLLALSTFPEETAATMHSVGNRVSELQGPSPTMDFSATRINTYCSAAFAYAGFIQFSQGKARGKRPPPKTVRMSPKGRSSGMAAAGALAPLELEAPEDAFLRKTVGVTQFLKESPRPTLYRHLLEQPRGVAELERLTGINYSVIAENVRDLCNMNVLSKVDKEDPTNRRYRISDQPYRDRRNTGPIAQALITAALALRDKQDHEASAAEILARAQVQLPDVPARELKQKFVHWVANTRRRSQFIMQLEADSSNSPHQKCEVRITAMYKPYVEKLLEVRRLLADNSSEGTDFRDDSRRRAEEIAGSPELMTALLASEARSPLRALSQSEWREQAEQLVPPEGISFKELYGATTRALGRHLSYGYFKDCLESSETLEVISQPTRKQRYVRLRPEPEPKKHVFTSDWAYDAACRDTDPELFFPPSLAGPSIRQAEEAKAICKFCPVRLACLKTAFDTGVTHGIQGGVWLENPGEMTPTLKATIRNTIRIVK